MFAHILRLRSRGEHYKSAPMYLQYPAFSQTFTLPNDFHSASRSFSDLPGGRDRMGIRIRISISRKEVISMVRRSRIQPSDEKGVKKMDLFRKKSIDVILAEAADE